MIKCCMTDDCPKLISYVDIKGFIYCHDHGQQRKLSVWSRKLTPAEITKLQNNQLISYKKRKAKQ